jgi:lipopolysaccharide biosynthesis regulator YciM
MFDLPPFVLGVAFVVVGGIAWFIGRRGATARTVRLPRDYYVGLDHLINDRFDRAAEVFARMAALGGEATEIQFALGSLFRRRGEVDRAIAIHTRLRDEGAPAVREKAAFALALDYTSAGLMDRAEALFQELAASREHRREALDHLVRIYEQQGDWANALKVFHELPPAVQQERRRVAAHYLCELAEHALVQGDAERALALVRQARTHDADLPRAGMLAARMAAAAGDAPGAFALYLDAVEHSPGLALEVIPRLLDLAREIGKPEMTDEISVRLKRTGRITAQQVEWLLASAIPTSDPSALGLLLNRIGDSGGRYQCDDCGLHSVGWYWRCPKCRAWDTMQPAVFKWADRTT